jgi:hypothetical protein
MLSSEGRQMTPTTNSFSLEEYRQVRIRQDLHENRSFQSIIFCVTAISAILSISSTATASPITPLVVALILLITTSTNLSNALHARYCAAYLRSKFGKEHPELQFENVYFHLFRTVPPSFRTLVGSALSPIVLLNYFGVALSITIFSVADVWKQNVLGSCALAAVVLLLHAASGWHIWRAKQSTYVATEKSVVDGLSAATSAFAPIKVDQ